MAPKVKERVDGYLFSGSTPGSNPCVLTSGSIPLYPVIVHRLLAVAYTLTFFKKQSFNIRV